MPKISEAAEAGAAIKLPRHIAHAGGSVNGVDYTNSLNALNENYAKGYRFIEIDLQLTSDNHLVLLHDWEASFTKLFGKPAVDKSYAEFMSAASPYTQLDIEGLAKWMDNHQDAHIILDTKANTLGTLKTIATKYPGLKNRLIPYIYTTAEYEPVEQLNFGQILLLVGPGTNDSEVTTFAAVHKIGGVAMPVAKAETLLPSSLAKIDTQTYTWTLNEQTDYEAVKQKGAGGVITDILLPACDQLPQFNLPPVFTPSFTNSHYLTKGCSVPEQTHTYATRKFITFNQHLQYILS